MRTGIQIFLIVVSHLLSVLTGTQEEQFGAADVPKLFALIPKPAGRMLSSELQAAAIGRAKNARLVMQRELADTGTCGNGKRTAQAHPQEQQLALFDFTRRGRDVLITRKN